MKGINDKKFVQAMTFARVAHGDQKRKYSGEEYWRHPYEVALIVRKVPHDLDMLCAAMLHDTIEDTHATKDDIQLFFGKSVANLVWDVTDISKPEDGNRAIRKALDRTHLITASIRAKTIKLADLIHNAQSIVQHDVNFAKVYMREKQKTLDVLHGGDPLLMDMANQLVKDYYLGRKK